MKFLKILLSLVLILVILLVGGVIFSDKILTHMTTTKNSRFENLKFSMKNGEITYDNFILNNKKLGKGRAIVTLSKGGLFGIIPKVELEEMNLENVDLEAIYAQEDKAIDSFSEKMEIVPQIKNSKTTDQFVEETTKETETLNNNVNTFINQKIREDLLATNNIKEIYAKSTDLKEKAAKIKELNAKSEILAKLINSEKENLENKIEKIELDRNMMLENISVDLSKLEKEISLNDVKNLDSYIFLDKGKNLKIVTNDSLKTAKLINEIERLPLKVKKLNINNGIIKAENLDTESKEKIEVNSENNLKSIITKSGSNYEIQYDENDLKAKTIYNGEDVIISNIEYDKNNILEGKKIKIASEVSLNKDEIKTTNKTVLNPEEESLLVQKMTTLKETEYQEITKKYDEQTQAVQKLIDSLNENKNKLDKLQKDLLSLNTMITIEETQSVSQPQNEVQSDKNEQKTNLNNTIMENIKNQQPQNNTDNKIKIN